MIAPKLLLIIGLAASATAFGQIEAGILVPASRGCEEIDEVMKANLANADKETEALATVLQEVEKPSDNACLPSLQDIGSMINASVPNFSLSGILTRIKEAACQEADRAVNRSLAKYRVVANAPYGLGHVRLGAGQGGDADNQIDWDNGKSVFDPLEREAIRAGGDLGSGVVDTIEDALPGTEGVNRTIRRDINEVDSRYRDSVDSARGAINDL